MSLQQKNRLKEILCGYSIQAEYCVFHHGDCIGADTQAEELAWHTHMAITVHPPINESKRAKPVGIGSRRIEKAKDYLDRNKDIVNESEVLIGCPKGFNEELRSGTWSTIRYAKKNNKKVIIIYPDGSIK